MTEYEELWQETVMVSREQGWHTLPTVLCESVECSMPLIEFLFSKIVSAPRYECIAAIRSLGTLAEDNRRYQGRILDHLGDWLADCEPWLRIAITEAIWQGMHGADLVLLGTLLDRLRTAIELEEVAACRPTQLHVYTLMIGEINRQTLERLRRSL